jgi:chromosome segregation ATPase
MSQNREIPELIQDILNQLNSMQSQLPNGELKIIQINIQELRHAQSEMKQDLSELKRKLLDPEDGVIVKVNQNTKHRLDHEEDERANQELLLEHAELVKWKGSVTKALWIIFSALVGILAKMFFLDK